LHVWIYSYYLLLIQLSPVWAVKVPLNWGTF